MSANKNKFTPVDNTEGGMLAKLFRLVLKSLNCDNEGVINSLIASYIRRNNNNPDKSKKSLSKSGLTKNIYATSMTFKMFCDLMFSYLRVKSVKIIVIVETEHGEAPGVDIKLTNNIVEEIDDEKEESVGGTTKESDNKKSK